MLSQLNSDRDNNNNFVSTRKYIIMINKINLKNIAEYRLPQITIGTKEKWQPRTRARMRTQHQNKEIKKVKGVRPEE